MRTLIIGIILSGISVWTSHSQVPDPRIEHARTLLENIVSGNYTAAVSSFDSVMTARMPAGILAQVWAALQKQVGEFQEMEQYRSEIRSPYYSVYLTCRFAHTLLDMKVVYNEDNKVAGMFFLPAKSAAWEIPSYADTSRFVRRKLEVVTDTFRLPAELTLPVNTDHFPLIVLVHGSGPNDMDETIWANKVFKDLAWGLSSRGIAVLRYTKRTLKYGRLMDPERITVKEEVIEDALSAIGQAGTIRGVDKIFLLGHSLGGYLAPWIARESKSLDGMIILAGNTRPMEDLLIEQMHYILGLDGFSHQDSLQLSELQHQVSLVKSRALNDTTPAASLPLGLSATYWLSLRDYHPVETSKALSIPMLILQGEADYQVTLKDFDGWKKGLSEKKNVSFHSFPKLNHLFIKGPEKSVPDDYYKSGHVAPEVIDTIAGWIQSRM